MSEPKYLFTITQDNKEGFGPADNVTVEFSMFSQLEFAMIPFEQKAECVEVVVRMPTCSSLEGVE